MCALGHELTGAPYFTSGRSLRDGLPPIRLAVSPWLNQDFQDLAFAVHGTPDVQLSVVDGDKHFVELVH